MSDVKSSTVDAIETEIRRELAEGLGRTGERLEQILRELALLRGELLGLVGQPGDAGRGGRMCGGLAVLQRGLANYVRVRGRAAQLQHALIVQREAVGLRKHEDVHRQYPLPGPLTLASLQSAEGGS